MRSRVPTYIFFSRTQFCLNPSKNTHIILSNTQCHFSTSARTRTFNGFRNWFLYILYTYIIIQCNAICKRVYYSAPVYTKKNKKNMKKEKKRKPVFLRFEECCSRYSQYLTAFFVYLLLCVGNTMGNIISQITIMHEGHEYFSWKIEMADTYQYHTSSLYQVFFNGLIYP